MVICGRPVATTGGHLHFFGQAADGVDGVRHAVRVLIRDGADWIKITATGGSTKSSDPLRPSFTVEELRTIVDEAHRRGKLTAAHTTAAKGVENVLDAGIDMIIHCVFWEPDGVYRYRPDLIDRAVADGRWINPTLYGGMYTEIEGLEAKRDRDGALAGRRGGAGEGPRRHGHPRRRRAAHGRAGREARRRVRHGVALGSRRRAWPRRSAGWGNVGLSNGQAIVAGTSASAEAIGVGDIAGRSPRAARPTSWWSTGNPLDDLTALQHIRDVWQAGRVVDREIY